MMETKNQQKTNWLFLVILLVLLGVFVGAVFWWQNTDIEQDYASVKVNHQNEESSENLLGGDRDEHGCIGSAGYVWCEEKQKCLRPWEEECTEAEDAEDAIPDDDRILLTPDNMQEYCNPSIDLASCRAEDFNFDSATKNIEFSSTEYGLKVNIPYNPDWGSTNFKVAPYDLVVDNGYPVLQYGPVGEGEGAGWYRIAGRILFVEARDANSVIESLSSDRLSGGFFYEPQKITIGNHEAVKYGERGLGDYYVIEVIGEKYNYRIGLMGAIEGEDPFTDAYNTANSIEFI